MLAKDECADAVRIRGMRLACPTYLFAVDPSIAMLRASESSREEPVAILGRSLIALVQNCASELFSVQLDLC